MANASAVTAPSSAYSIRWAPMAPDRRQEAWDALLPDSTAGFYLSHRWLTSLRGTKGYDDLTWSVLDRTDRLSGLVPVHLTPRPLHNALYDLYDLFGGGFAAELGPEAWSPQLVVGSRSGYANAPMTSHPSVLPAWVAAAVEAVRHTGCASAAIPYLEEDAAAEVAALLPGHPVLLSGARCRITLGHEDFDGYLDRLPASRRAIVRADLRSFARGGRSVETSRLNTGHAGTLAPLLAAVQHRHGSAVGESEVASYLRGCAAPGLDASTVLFTCRDGADVIAFTLAYRFGSTLVVRVVGLDYERVGRHAEYFTLLVHEPVRYALRHGLTTVDLGTEGYRAKLLRGAAPVPLWSVLLRSPARWDDAAVREHNDRARAEVTGSCADLGPEIAAFGDRPPVAPTEEVR